MVHQRYRTARVSERACYMSPDPSSVGKETRHKTLVHCVRSVSLLRSLFNGIRFEAKKGGGSAEDGRCVAFAPLHQISSFPHIFQT